MHVPIRDLRHEPQGRFAMQRVYRKVIPVRLALHRVLAARLPPKHALHVTLVLLPTARAAPLVRCALRGRFAMQRGYRKVSPVLLALHRVLAAHPPPIRALHAPLVSRVWLV